MDENPIQPLPQPQIQPPVPVKPGIKFLVFRVVRILIITLVIIAVIIGGYFVLVKYFPQYAKYVQPYVGSVLDPTLVSLGLQDENFSTIELPQINQVKNDSNLQIYKSEEYGFEIGVPTGGFVKISGSKDKPAFEVNDSSEKTHVTVMPHGFTSELPFGNEEPVKTIIQISGSRASQWKWSDHATIKILDVKKNWTSDNIIYVVFNNESLANQIINTFKFVQPTPINLLPTGNWLTYKSKEFNYEFKYPADWVVSSKIIPADDLTSASEEINISPKNKSEHYPTISIIYMEVEDRIVTSYIGKKTENIIIDKYTGTFIWTRFKDYNSKNTNIDPEKIISLGVYVERGKASMQLGYSIANPGAKSEADMISPTQQDEELFRTLLSTIKFESNVAGQVGPDAEKRDEEKLTVYKHIKVEMDFYYQDHGIFPNNLSEIETGVNDWNEQILGHSYPLSQFSYSLRPDKKEVHLGVSLETTTKVDSESDGDFNSITTGWSNGGFDGSDTKKCKSSDTNGSWCYDFRIYNAIEGTP